MRAFLPFLAVAATITLAAAPGAVRAQLPTPESYAELHWRGIGPVRAGRARARTYLASRCRLRADAVEWLGIPWASWWST